MSLVSVWFRFVIFLKVASLVVTCDLLETEGSVCTFRERWLRKTSSACVPNPRADFEREERHVRKCEEVMVENPRLRRLPVVMISKGSNKAVEGSGLARISSMNGTTFREHEWTWTSLLPM